MKYKKMDDVCSVITDYVANGSFASLKQNVKHQSQGYAAVIRLKDYRNNFNGPFEYVSKASYEFLKKTKLMGKEIIISNVGANIGTVFKAPTMERAMTLGPNAIMIKTKYIDDYYYYLLKSNYGQDLLRSIVSGSAQPKFNKTDFKTLEVPVPTIEEQKHIVDQLTTIDDKIHKNNQINDNLLELLDTEFSHRFINNSKYSMDIVSNFVSIKRGASPRPIKDFLSESGRPWIKISDVTKLTNPFLYDTAQFIKQSGINKSRTIIPGTLILSNSATPGIPIISEILASVHDGWLIVDNYTRMNRDWFYLFFRQMRKQLVSRANGSVFNNLKTDIVKDFPVPVVDKDNLLEFKKLTDPIFMKLNQLQKENIELSKIKDSLLKQYF